MAKNSGLSRGILAVWLIGTLGSPFIGARMAYPIGPNGITANDTNQQSTPSQEKPDFASPAPNWVTEFDHLTGKTASSSSATAPDAADRNVLTVSKAMPGPVSDLPEGQPLNDAPKADVAAVPDDPQLKTGSVGKAASMLLPPVPGPDSFRFHKSDRLANGSHSEPAPVTPDTDAHPVMSPNGPHSELMRLPPGIKPSGIDPAAPWVTGAISRRPLDLSPSADQVFQGPPTPPGDPAVDPNAPVLGYIEPSTSAEAPFRALFGVSSAEKKSWLAGKPVLSAALRLPGPPKLKPDAKLKPDVKTAAKHQKVTRQIASTKPKSVSHPMKLARLPAAHHVKAKKRIG